MKVRKIVERISSGYVPSVDEVEFLLAADGPDASYIFKKADEITLKHCSNEVHIRGIIEFSNYCRCSCAYCGLNAANRQLQRYRMKPQEIVDVAKEAWNAGYKTIVLQSGEDLWYTKDVISEIIKKIKDLGDIAITLSVGERDYDEYKQWHLDGADRFLLKHETINEKLYNRLHPHSNLKNRIRCIRQLRDLKYQVGSGFMVGLPGQTLKDIAKDILFLKELDVDMAGIGPFIPHKGTPLGNKPAGSNKLSLKALAVTRLILKDVHLPATSALCTLGEDNARKAFSSGANVIMQKLEPFKYRRLYDIYPKKLDEKNSIKQERMEIEHFIQNLGKQVAKDRGDSIKFRRVVTK